MNTDTIIIGVNLMFIGMGTVFIFLLIMIFAMEISHKLIEILNKYFPEEDTTVSAKKNKKENNDNSQLAIAIACAYKKLKEKNNG